MRQTLTLPLLLLLFIPSNATATFDIESEDPSPAKWPEQFHALLYTNLSTGHLLVSDMWYDWPRGLNFYLRQNQLGPLLYDVEWNNGTSFYFTRAGSESYCHEVEIGVGITRPDFLNGSTYLGVRRTDGFLCNLWEKIDFIWYYEDVVSRRPVRWDFSDGISTHVMTFEVGAVLEEPGLWQAPAYCFGGGGDSGGDGDGGDGDGGEVKDRNWTDNREGLLDHSLRKLISTF